MRTSTRAMMALTAAVAAALTTPAIAAAATVNVTGDDGNPVALNPAAATSVRQMKTDVGVALEGTEKRYTLTTAGPGGPASTALTCFGSPTSQWMNYQGNGTYTVTLTTYTNTNGACTTGPKTTTYQVRSTPAWRSRRRPGRSSRASRTTSARSSTRCRSRSTPAR